MHVASHSTRPSPETESRVLDDRNRRRGNGAADSSDSREEPDTTGARQDIRSDAELLSQFVQTRDAAAFAAIVVRYQRLVMGVALRQVGDRHRAEDVFQATFLVLAEKAGRIRRPESLPGWLHGTARRIGLASLAESRRHPAMNPADQTDTSDPILEQMQTAYERQMLDEELEELPQRLRLPLVLHYLEGLTGREVAERLGLSVDTVEGRLKKGRKELRQRLVKQGVGFGAVLAAFQMSQQLAAASTTPLVEATAASSVAWVTQQPLEACTANAARLAGKDLAAMTAAKTTTLLTCTAVACLATGLIGSWALGAGNGSGRGALPTITGAEDAVSESPLAEPTLELSQFDYPAESPSAVTEPVFSASPANTGVSNYQSRSASRETIEAALDDAIFEEDLYEIPLSDVVELLTASYEIPVRLDEQHLLDAGISPDELISGQFSGIPLRDALELLCENVSGVPLDYVIENSVLKITTAEVAEEKLETVIYELRHLYPNLRTEDIIDLLQNSTSGPWFDTDGIGGTIVELPGAVAVRQTQRAHREIAALLEQVKEFAARSDLPDVERTTRSESEELPTVDEGGFGGGFGGG